jgi:hypothetical protein
MNAQIELAPLSLDDFAALGKILRRLERKEDAPLEKLANWKLVFNLYRETELKYTIANERKSYEETHRAVLTNLIAITERLFEKARELSDGELQQLQFPRAAFDVCLKYLRGKYNAWYVPIDPEFEKEFEKRMAALS